MRPTRALKAGHTIVNMRKPTLILVAVLLCVSSALMAQDGVPTEILQRTIFIKAGTEAGTAFGVDYAGKMFLVTARHVIAGLPAQGAVIQILQENQWKDYHTVRTLFPTSKDVDIAVFETNEKVPTPYGVSMAGEAGGVTLGQQVWFLGYPFGIASHFGPGGVAPFSKGGALPFIKRGTMSAIDGTNPDAVVIYIDGFNNPGFSGGPILYWSFSKQSYEILGVVQGYKEDSAKVLVNGQHVDTQVLVNTGILVGYSIGHALEAIKDNEKQLKFPARPAH
jgi:hypothetical protein